MIKQEFCFVVDKNGTPLAPTKKWCFIRKMLRKRKAKIVRYHPFTVKLLYLEVDPNKVSKCTFCIDPGKTTGLAIIKNDTNEIPFLGEFELNSHKISEKLQKRREYRRQKKRYQRQKRIRRAIKCRTTFKGIKEFKYPKMKSGIKCKYIRPKPPKYLNRKKKTKYTPTVKHFLQSLLRIINDLRKFIAIERVKIEFVPFDIRKLQEPWIKGFWYQVPNKGKFSRWAEYIKHRDNYKCVKCDSNKDLEVHHIIPKSRGGKDNPKNMITLCRKCHEEIHKNVNLFNKWKNKFEKYVAKVEKKNIKDVNTRYASYMNQVIKDLIRHLDVEVELVSPLDVINNRKKMNLDKTHYNDAIAIYSDNVRLGENRVFEILKLTRHPTRLCTMGIEDRMYSYKPKTKKSKPVAFNKKPRLNQKKTSLQDLVKKYGKNITGKLTIYRKGNIRYRLRNQKYVQGDIIIYNDTSGEKIGIVWLTKNRHKYVKLLDGTKVSFKNIKHKIRRKILIYF